MEVSYAPGIPLPNKVIEALYSDIPDILDDPQQIIQAYRFGTIKPDVVRDQNNQDLVTYTSAEIGDARENGELENHVYHKKHCR